MRRLLRIFSFIFLVLSAQCVLADNPMPIKLRMTALVNNRHAYYVALLDESLRAAGYLPQIELLDPMPQQRQWAAVKTGELTLAWGVQTTERDKEFVGVNNRLTNGLIGLRVFLVPKTSKEAYAHVRTLSDLRALKKIGGAGDGWFDVELWRLNRLPLEVFKGDWNRLFGMVAAGNRGVDYMIRGAHEAVIDVQSNPDLVSSRICFSLTTGICASTWGHRIRHCDRYLRMRWHAPTEAA